MPTVEEIRGAQSPLQAALDEGVRSISENQTVTFVKYIRVVLPADGFVFWVRGDLLSQSAILNAGTFNAVAFNANPTVLSAATEIKVEGSLHYATDSHQNEDERIAVQRVEFTALRLVEELAQVNPGTLYFAMLPDGNRYTFGGRRSFYQQAGLYHYTGDAVYPALATQVIDSPLNVDLTYRVVSNSLPFWLAMDLMNPPLGWPPAQAVPLFPSYLVPDNLPPPYGAVHIAPESTMAIQAVPFYDRRLGHHQLVKERVDVTLYGLRNFNAMDFVDYVYNYTVRMENFGIMNMPVIRDEKRTQLEISAIAMKKKITFEIDYYQERARDVARQLILSVCPTFDIDTNPLYRRRPIEVAEAQFRLPR